MMNTKRSKARVLAVGFLVAVLWSGCAPVEPQMSYQGQLTDNSGAPVGDGDYQMTFRLYSDEGDAVGDAAWSETQTVAVSDGLFNATIGADNPIAPSTFAQTLWLGVEVESDGEMTPRQRLTGAPYAMSLVPGAAIQGTVNLDDEYPGVVNVLNRGDAAGVAVGFWGDVGVAVDGRFSPDMDIVMGDTGLKIDHVQHGAAITATEGIGLRVQSDGTTSGDDDVIRAEGVSDGIVSITTGTGSADYGVYGQSQGGRGIYGYTVTGTYAGYFDGDIYVQGCNGCTLSYMALNTSSHSLQPGELVAAAGVDDKITGLRLPVIQVTSELADRPVLGAVLGRTDLVYVEPEGGGGPPRPNFDDVGGPAGPGDYVAIVVQGPAQVRVDAAVEIQAGDMVYPAPAGLSLNGASSAIGMALDTVDAEGLVWVMLGFD
jgi:hypothetical protein